MSDSGILAFALLMLGAIFDYVDAAGVLTADAVAGVDAGVARIGEGQEVGNARVDSPDLILDGIDKRVVKIRPYDVVLDTIARNATVRKMNDQVIRHYAIDVIPLTANVTTAVTASPNQVELLTDNKDIFAREQTIIVNGVSGYKPDGTTVDTDNDLILYVVGKSTAGNPLVVAVNGTGTNRQGIPAIALNTVLTRAGRAGSEWQIATDPYSGVPTDVEVYLQKFIAQVEMSDIFERATKDVDWTFNDAEEEALYDLRRTMELTFLKGVKSRIKVQNAHSEKPEDTYFTQGVWAQAGKDFSFGGVAPTDDSIVTMMKNGFAGNNGSKKKLLIGGSDFVEALEKVDYQKVVYVGTKNQLHGIEYNGIISKFGTAMLTYSFGFDEAGLSAAGMLLDPEFLVKYTLGWRTQTFDLRKAAKSDADARMLMEICALALKNPKAHMRVTLA